MFYRISRHLFITIMCLSGVYEGYDMFIQIATVTPIAAVTGHVGKRRANAEMDTATGNAESRRVSRLCDHHQCSHTFTFTSFQYWETSNIEG